VEQIFDAPHHDLSEQKRKYLQIYKPYCIFKKESYRISAKEIKNIYKAGNRTLYETS